MEQALTLHRLVHDVGEPLLRLAVDRDGGGAGTELPLTSVERCFIHLTGLTSQHRSEANVTLVPMGPKPPF